MIWRMIDIKKASLYYGSKTGIYKHLYEVFGEFSPAYTLSNEFLDEAMGFLKPQGQSVLTVAGSGDQAFWYKLYGASHVDTFDISYCAQVVMNLKTCALQNMNRDEYKKFTKSLRDADTEICDMPGYEKISDRLDRETKGFIDGMRGCRWRLNGGYILNILSESEYQNLQNTIRAPFNFIWSDVFDLSGRVTEKYGRKYDQIYLSNIVQYNCTYEKLIKLITSLLPVLNDKGMIMLFVTPFLKYDEVSTIWSVADALKKFVSIRIDKVVQQQYVLVKKL